MSVESQAQSPLLHARGLVKLYGSRRVVDNLSLECRAGEILGLLGPNGAGKTTTLRMLYGFVQPDGGSIAYAGRPFGEDRQRVKASIGVCTQDDTIDYDLNVEQNLRVYARYFRTAVRPFDARLEDLLRDFDLLAYRKASPRTLSGGFRQRLLIARALVHQPRILYLDEPTTGLDPQARIGLWGLIAGLRAEGMGIVLTTHYMEEADRLADRLVVLKQGRCAAEGRRSEVLGRLVGDHTLVLEAKADIADRVRLWAAERLQRTPFRVLEELRLPLRSAELSAFLSAFPQTDHRIEAPSLDDLFLCLSREHS